MNGLAAALENVPCATTAMTRATPKLFRSTRAHLGASDERSDSWGAIGSRFHRTARLRVLVPDPLPAAFRRRRRATSRPIYVKREAERVKRSGRLYVMAVPSVRCPLCAENHLGSWTAGHPPATPITVPIANANGIATCSGRRIVGD